MWKHWLSVPNSFQEATFLGDSSIVSTEADSIQRDRKP